MVLDANSAFFAIMILLLIAPKHVSVEVTLGAVMQIVAAFMAVQAALIRFVDTSCVWPNGLLQEALQQLDTANSQ